MKGAITDTTLFLFLNVVFNLWPAAANKNPIAVDKDPKAGKDTK